MTHSAQKPPGENDRMSEDYDIKERWDGDSKKAQYWKIVLPQQFSITSTWPAGKQNMHPLNWV